MKLKLLACFSILVLSGCAQKPSVNVNAMTSGVATGKNIVIIPARQELWNSNQLEYMQISRVVASTLSSSGYRMVDKVEDADQAILLDFNRSGAVSQARNVTMPIYGQTGVSSSTTYGTANTTLNNYGYGYGTANTTGTSTTVYNPTYGITGTYNTTVVDTFYGAAVSIQSFDSRKYLKTKQAIMLWKSIATYVSSNADNISDYKGLARIASSFADKNTNGSVPISVDLRESN
ncbi:hypothetical protein [Serratia surfactantfaciens]|uniref:DUF4136 domain-containing protein n=1 Tax=Serratia surfactantfaciens TaxID=2741499 RepID=A0ABS0LUB9_9GAMM|nr:hypothetical protein [Serratia surfactantfaciens]MBH1918925.1 hypothetical protein [Serratia surfactantfaciens]